VTKSLPQSGSRNRAQSGSRRGIRYQKKVGQRAERQRREKRKTVKNMEPYLGKEGVINGKGKTINEGVERKNHRRLKYRSSKRKEEGNR